MKALRAANGGRHWDPSCCLERTTVQRQASDGHIHRVRARRPGFTSNLDAGQKPLQFPLKYSQGSLQAHDHHHLIDPGLDPIRSISPTSIASSDTLSCGSLSPGVDNLGTILGHPLVAEPESTSTTVWLAPSPVSILTGLRYSRRDKLCVMLHHRSLCTSYL